MQQIATIAIQVTAPDRQSAAEAVKAQVSELVSHEHFRTIKVCRFEEFHAGQFEAALVGPVDAIGALALAIGNMDRKAAALRRAAPRIH